MCSSRKIKTKTLKINPPIAIPPNFRGKINYDKDKCTGCGLCIRVCPAYAIELTIPGKDEKGREIKKVMFYVSRCAFCSQCIDVCPKDAIKMSDEFLIANTDGFADELVVGRKH